MGGLFGSSQAPTAPAPPPLPPAALPPSMAQPSVAAAAANQRAKAAAAAGGGYGNTLFTGPQGTGGAPTATKQLTGQ